jgi:hypothetical protein
VGTFAYTPASGTVLDAGLDQPLSVTFTPTDSQDFNTSSATVHLDVQPATIIVTAADATMTYGDSVPSIGSTFGGFVNGDDGSVISGSPLCSTAATSSSSVGSYTSTCDITGLSAANYVFAEVDGTVTVNQATPVLNWNTPNDVTYGVALSNVQLDATATGPFGPIAGTFAYTPLAGTVLTVGNAQVLSATFTPSDSADYVSGVQVDTQINVAAAPAFTYTGPSKTYGNTATVSASLAGVSGRQVTFTFAPLTASALQTCTATTNGSGVASCTLSNLTGGGWTLRVSFAGDNTYGPRTISSSINVFPGTLAYTGPTTIAGTSATVSASFLAGGQPVVGRQVSFTFAPNTPSARQTCSASTNSAGTASCSLSNLTAGSWYLQVSFAGDSQFNATSVTTSVTATPPTLSYSGASNFFGVGATSVTASFTAGSQGVSGKQLTFTFAPNSTTAKQICTATTNNAGVASCTMPNLTAGSNWTMRVSFAGDSGITAKTVNTSVNVYPNVLNYTGPVTVSHSGATFSAVFAGGAGKQLTFTFAPLTSSVRQTCTATTNSSGVASCQMTNLATGGWTMQVSWAGDGQIAAATVKTSITVTG